MIRVELSDWLYNAGIIGLYRMLEYADKEISIMNNAIEINEDFIENFGDIYFGYLINKYLEYTSYHKIISMKSEFERYTKDEMTVKQFNLLNEKIEVDSN